MAHSCMSTRERVSHLVGERWGSAGGSMSWLWPTRSRRRRAHVCHGVRIADLDCMRTRAAAALHQLQRGLPELQQLLTCGVREHSSGSWRRWSLGAAASAAAAPARDPPAAGAALAGHAAARAGRQRRGGRTRPVMGLCARGPGAKMAFGSLIRTFGTVLRLWP